ncbi:MAG: hypothetical protein ACLROG_12065 [Coprococcus phoceensis]
MIRYGGLYARHRKTDENFIVRSRKANIVFTGVSTNGGLPFFLLLVMIL